MVNGIFHQSLWLDMLNKPQCGKSYTFQIVEGKSENDLYNLGGCGGFPGIN